MSEKEKRKEKPKRNNRRFIGFGLLSVLIIFAGIVFILIPDGCACSLFMPGTSEAIETANSIALTQISASMTAEFQTATSTAISLDDIRLTATALDDLGLHTATPTPNP